MWEGCLDFGVGGARGGEDGEGMVGKRDFVWWVRVLERVYRRGDTVDWRDWIAELGLNEGFGG